MEIERKFLIKEIPNYLKDNLGILEPKNMIQYYIGDNPEIRIRLANNIFTLTIKSGQGLVRHEVETDITEEDFNSIINMGNFPYVSKTRYNVPIDSNVIELDIYENMEGLITAEVEFNTIEDAENFVPPNWFYTELTNKKGFSNRDLAFYGYVNSF